MSASALSVPIAQFKPVCSNCGWRELCLPAGLSLEELARLTDTAGADPVELVERLVSARRKVKRGHSLYQVDDPFGAVYAVWKGFFKSNAYLEDGREQVTGFHMPGDLIGVDGINADRHTCNAIALEDSDVCVIPFSRFEELSNEVPRLRRQFHVMMSRGMARGQAAMPRFVSAQHVAACCGKGPAVLRVASVYDATGDWEFPRPNVRNRQPLLIQVS